MARRENGAGTEPKQEANGRWSLKISYRDVNTDEPKRTTIRGASQGEVLQKKKDFIKNIEAGVKPNQKKITFQEWLNKWLEANKKISVSNPTYSGYKIIVDKHITGTALGKMLLDKVKRADLQQYFNEKAKEVAASYLALIKVVLSDALNVAELDQLILKSPCKSIKLPKIQKEEINPLTQNEINLLLDAAGSGSYLYAVIFFALRTGMRLGEVAGVRWADIDFKKKGITVRQQSKADPTGGEKHVLGTLKTPSAYRNVPLDSRLADVLKWHQRRQDKLKADLSVDSYNPLGLVFCKDDGELIQSHSLGKKFARLMDTVDIPKRTFHDLRHTFASVAICQGLSIKAVSKVLGHSKPSITLDIYSHCMPGDEESIVVAVAGYYDRKPETVIETVSGN